MMWMRGIATLMIMSTGLLTYSVFWQAPTIRTEVAREFARVDGRIELTKKDIESARTDISDLRTRVGNLEKTP